MASLVKDANDRSPFWYCAYTDATGRRLKKSTGETRKSEAQKICLQWQRAVDMARRRTLTEERSREIIGEILASINGGEGLRSFTVRQWFEHFCKIKTDSQNPKTADKYDQIKTEFLDFLGAKAENNILSISSSDVRAFRDSCKKNGLSATTLNDRLTILSSYFNGAWRDHVISNNPCTAVEPARDNLTPAKRQKKPFSVEQVRAMLHKAPGDWRGLIKVAFYTGARLENCANLRFRNLDFNAEPPVVTFENYSKHGDEHTVPMHPALEDHLLSLSTPKEDDDFLFPSLAGRRVANLSKQFRKLMQAARIENRKVREAGKGAARDVWALGFHSFRRTNVSILANAGVPEEQTNGDHCARHARSSQGLHPARTGAVARCSRELIAKAVKKPKARETEEKRRLREACVVSTEPLPDYLKRIDVKLLPEGVKLIALSGDDMRYAAYRIASELKLGNHNAAASMLFSFKEPERIPELLKLVVEAYEGSGRFEPTTTRRRIIQASFAAAPFINGEAIIPTLDDVKRQFERLYTHAELPSDETFKRAFRELPPLSDWRKRQGGRPRGSKDQDPRKRRNEIRSRKAAQKVSVFARSGSTVTSPRWNEVWPSSCLIDNPRAESAFTQRRRTAREVFHKSRARSDVAMPASDRSTD